MQKIEFYKMHGLGNDFVIIDRRKNHIKIDKDIIQKLSDRNTGAGCDQVITIENNISPKYDVSIEIFNPNGDIAEACGNGTRCVAKLIFEEKNMSHLKIKSLAGVLTAFRINDNMISVNMGKLSSNWRKIPLTNKVNTLEMPIKIDNLSPGIAVNIGNPHIVFFGETINSIDLQQLGPHIENHELFPEKTNVEIVEIINRKTIKMRVWERGAGITLACGSGACAAVYACILKEYTDNKVEVQLEKGSLEITIQNNEAIMLGPAEVSYKGYINI